jgi:hypothetical protein
MCHADLLAAREQNQDRLSWSCSQAVGGPVWHIPSLHVQWGTPDNGQRNCPKHVEFYSKDEFEKLVHLVGFTIRTHCNNELTCILDILNLLILIKNTFQNWLCCSYFCFCGTTASFKSRSRHLRFLNHTQLYTQPEWRFWNIDQLLAKGATYTTYKMHEMDIHALSRIPTRWRPTP